ncbi:putative iron-regulated protein [Sulfitobacter undariae]|uniref:Putative iron-regulated protein n=1 Tax=Sulfitobacter undariae TaxID=1563671 RepID=A0A7W6GYQ7_9RHOB|nr:ChaN family lipoprotein [Sulfitobacter undariae]MBB3993091.1 putative iron-regulated protein [Sulfitobacter undariae]
MKRLKTPLTVLSAGLMVAFFSTSVAAEIPAVARDAQIVVLGEQHDNPEHHQRQAEWVAALSPRAVVFEMLTPEQAEAANFEWTDQGDLDAAIGWADSNWPSFDMYFPIFAAAPKAVIYGAGVPRDVLSTQLQQPLADHPLAPAFGLDQPTEPDQQAAREALQAVAHCNALPIEMLPVMVDAQRLRDASLADAALRAVEQTGGPVVVITGNGHARMDWAAPALMAFAAPDVEVFALGQGEEGNDVEGEFSLTLDAPAPKRDDPCAAFAQ